MIKFEVGKVYRRLDEEKTVVFVVSRGDFTINLRFIKLEDNYIVPPILGWSLSEKDGVEQVAGSCLILSADKPYCGETEGEEEPEANIEEVKEEDKEEETTKPAEGLTLSSKDFTLFSAGSSYKLTVTGAKGDVTFTSSNEKVATVAKDGTVTAVAPGRADITVTSGKDKASCVVRCKWEESKPETKPEEKPEESTSVDLSAFYSDMTATYEFGHLEQFTGDVLESYYAGMGAVSTKQCLVMGTMMSMNNGEFCLVEVSDSKDVDTVKSIFQARIDFMVDGGAWYPGPTEQWTNNSRVVSNGNYVMMVVHENCDDIVDAFNALF